VILGGGVAVCCLFTFVGALRCHLYDSTAFLFFNSIKLLMNLLLCAADNNWLISYMAQYVHTVLICHSVSYGHVCTVVWKSLKVASFFACYDERGVKLTDFCTFCL